MTQHGSLNAERWAHFDLDRQILMIGNEMNRTSRLLGEDRGDARRLGYERVLRLTDLTVACQPKPTFRRELLRWRDLVAALYVSTGGSQDSHFRAFRALLQLRPMAAKQIPFLLR